MSTPKEEKTIEIPQCAICMEKFSESELSQVNRENSDEKESNIKTLRCKHTFHKECVDQWIELKNECPLCREQADLSKPVGKLNVDDGLSRDAIHQLISRVGISSNAENFFRTIIMRELFGGSGGSLEDILNYPFGLLSSGSLRNQPRIRLQPTSRTQTSQRNILFPSEFSNSLFSRCNHAGECIDVQCAHCRRIRCVYNIKRCSKCKTRYCSVECQKADWLNGHQEHCK